MSDPETYRKCSMPDCILGAQYKCEWCSRDLCFSHRVMSGDDDLCEYCEKQKKRGYYPRH